MNHPNISGDLVTIVIPCYRQAHFILRAIRSCIEQTYQQTEIIVVDDGSPDNLPDVIKPCENRIKLIRQNNRGLSEARNAGIKAATGKYIKFLDADDWLLPHCIALQYYSISMLESHISVIGHSLYHDDSDRIPENIYPDFDRLLFKLCYVNSGPPHTFLFPIEAIRRIGGFDTSSRIHGGHEDYDLLCRLALEGYDAVAVHKIGCVYRQYDNSMSTNLERMSRSRSNVWQHYAHELLKKDTDPELLTHMFGGYALRLASGDFRYENMDIFKGIVTELRQNISSLSSASAIMLCSHLSKLYRCMPKAKDTREKSARRISIALADELTNLAIRKIPEGTILKTRPIQSLLGLLNSMFWIERGYAFRKLLAGFQSLRIPLWLIKLPFALIKFPSFFFHDRADKKSKAKK